MSRINKMGPVKKITAEKFHKLYKNKNNIVLDGRDYDSFAGQHIPGTYHIDCGGKFSTFGGWVLPPDKKILLVANNQFHAETMALKLRRVGLDNIIGYLDGAMFEWSKMGYETNHMGILSVPEAYAMMNGREKIMFVDVRSPAEFAAENISGTVNIAAPDLRTRFAELNKEDNILLSCTTGHRSSLGGSIIMQKGFKKVFNIAGGLSAFNAYGKKKTCKACKQLKKG